MVRPDVYFVINAETEETHTPEEIDAELAEVLYGDRCHELSRFFFRRTNCGKLSAALLAETFAKAAMVRQKRDDKSAMDHAWLTSIATLELSRFFTAGEPASKAVQSLAMAIPELTDEYFGQIATPVPTLI